VLQIVWLGGAPEHGCRGACDAANVYFHMNRQTVMRSDCEDTEKGTALLAEIDRQLTKRWPAGWAAIQAGGSTAIPAVATRELPVDNA